MSNYDLLLNQTVTASAPPPQGNIVQPWGPNNPKGRTQTQAFQLVVTGTAGNVSGTAQNIDSNDGVNWVSYGSPMVAASTYLVAQAVFGGTQPWKFFGAYLTAISGTGAQATLKMSA
jgi:hypothetical protein